MSRVAFVTGASSGLGAGLARRLARDGWAVALAARRVEALEAVRADIERDGGRALVVPCDVADPGEVRRAMAECERGLGPVDLLVCNAGVSETTRVEAFRADEIERILRVNVLGAAYAIEMVLPGMLGRGSGHLVGIGSLTGYGGLPRTAAYSASKGALHNLFESLRIDLRGTGVAVTFITPGYVRTPLTARNLHRMPFLMDLDDAVERMARGIERRARLVSFPWPMATAVWVAQVLPAAVYDWLGSHIRREKRSDPPA
jgi:short-subunit dehydrogenase